MNLISNTFLEDQASKIRAKPVPWEGYQRAELITSEELALIRKVDRQPRAKVESVLLSDGPAFALLYLNLLKKLARVDTMQYILSLVAEALTGHDERIPLFIQTSKFDPELPYMPLLKALETSDEFVQLNASRILTTLLTGSELPPHVLKPFISVLAEQLGGNPSAPNKQDVAVQCLETLLPNPTVRKEVWNQPRVIQALVDMLKANPAAQMSYQISFCFWLLSFDPEISAQLDKKYDLIPLLVDIAQGAPKEKIIRVIMGTFRNLVSKAPSENLPSMLVAKLLPYVQSLASRKLADEEIVEDVEYLQNELSEQFETLTNYDEYLSELRSGHLSWSPVHVSESFWQENAEKLNEKDQEALKILVKLLKTSRDPVVLAVAAHDAGQYAKCYERGGVILNELGAKTRIMELMGHSNSEVRYQALITVQRLVSKSWIR